MTTPSPSTRTLALIDRLNAYHSELTVEAAAELTRLSLRERELESALRPFAKAADELRDDATDGDGVMWDGIVALARAGDLRRARLALTDGGER